MHSVIKYVLLADLETSDTLTFVNDLDEMRFSEVGHVLNYNDVRYTSPTDFTLEIDGSGNVTITWLSADTLASGSTIRLGVALIDAITKGSDAGAGGGSFDDTDIVAGLDTINDTLNTPVDELAPHALTRGRLTKVIIGTGGVALAGADTDQIVALVAAQRIRVYKGWLRTDIACDLTFRSGVAGGPGDQISAVIPLAAGGSYIIKADDDPEIETAVGERLALTKSTAATLTGELWYKAEAD